MGPTALEFFPRHYFSRNYTARRKKTDGEGEEQYHRAHSSPSPTKPHNIHKLLQVNYGCH